MTNAGAALLSTSCALRCKIGQVTSKAAGLGKTAAEARAAGFRSVPEGGAHREWNPHSQRQLGRLLVSKLCLARRLRSGFRFAWLKVSAYASIWFQKFAVFKKPFP